MVHCFCCKDGNIYLEEHYYLVAGNKYKQISPTEFEIAILIARMLEWGNTYILKREEQNN